MPLAYAARVGHGVAHHTVARAATGIGLGVTIAVGVIGAAAAPEVGAIAGVGLLASRAMAVLRTLGSVSWSAILRNPFSLVSAATSQAIRLPMARANVVAFGGSTGRSLGGLFDSVDLHAGEIVDGCRTVLIGPGRARAAFASPRARVSCHGGAYVNQGSTTVHYENLNASRDGDATSCFGIISEGERTVLVGGDRSYAPDGSDLPIWYQILSGSVDLLDFVSGIPHEWMRAGTLTGATAAADAVRDGTDVTLWVARRTAQLLGFPSWVPDLIESARQGLKAARFRPVPRELDELRQVIAGIKSASAGLRVLP